MFRLTREVRFAVNQAPDQQLRQDPQSPTNGYAGFPTLTTVGGSYQTLAVTLEGELDPRTGYLRNIKEIDERIRRTLLMPIVNYIQSVREKRESNLGLEVLAELADELKKAWPGSRLHLLKWNLTPFLSITAHPAEYPMIRLSQKFEFSASHRLHSAELSDEENRRCFGKCNNPHGHGHNYEVQVTLIGDAKSHQGTLIEIPEFERIVGSTVIERFDHKNLNVEVPEFTELMPSVENIARVIFDLLKPKLETDRAKLAAVTVWETPKTWCEYSESL